jgi:hypothetical protein
MRTPALSAELAQRNEEHEEAFYILVTKDQALDLSSGYVPLLVRSMARTMLEWQDDLKRAAERPVPKPRKVKR